MATNSKQSATVFNRIALVGVSFAMGLVFGILAIVAIQNFVPRDEQSTQEVAQGEFVQTTTDSTTRTSTTDRIDVGRFQEVFKHDSISEQYLALHTTLSHTTEQELKDWWIQSKNIERSSHREIAQQIILRNLTAINPQQAVQYLNEVSPLLADALLRTIFNEWAVLDLDGAIQAAAKLLRTRRTVALEAILKTRDDLSEDELRAIAVQLDRAETYDKLSSEVKALQSIANPRESWSILLNDNVDDSLQTESLVTVAEAWHEQIGFEVLSKIYAEIDDFGSKVYLLEAIARVDPAGALEYTYGLNANYDKLNLSTIIVRDLAKRDAPAALNAISSLEPSSFSSKLEETAATTWARTAPANVIENVGAIPEQFRLSALESAFATIARRDPMEALDKITSVDAYVGNTSSILNKIVTEWSYQQPDVVADWVVKNFIQDDSQRRSLLMQVLPRLARQDPDHAFELAKTYTSTTHQGVGLDYLVIRELASVGNLEAAKQFLPQVKESSKSAVYSTVGELMIRESEELEALELGKNLSEKQQDFYYVRVMSLWAATKPKKLYESLKDLPTDSLVSKAALHLILTNRRQPVLSKEQIDHATSLLSFDDELHLNRIINLNL